MLLKEKFSSESGYIAIAAIAITLAVITFVLYGQSVAKVKTLSAQLNDAQKQLQKQSPVAATPQEIKDLVNKIGKLIDLPTGEDPIVATVTDLSKLQGQPFFANAQLQDKVLIYSTAKKAILYRPSTNKIVEVAPLNLGTQAATPAK